MIKFIKSSEPCFEKMSWKILVFHDIQLCYVVKFA